MDARGMHDHRQNRDMVDEKLSIVVAVNNRQILQSNLLRSPALADPRCPHQIIIRENFATAGAAYNSGLDEAVNDLVVFIHQDMYLPADWVHNVVASIRALEASGENWGVVGCSGVTRERRAGLGQIYSTGLGVIGMPLQQPTPVDTLDEIVLVIRKSRGLRFDPDVPGYHMYGTDICLEARSRGMRSFSIQAFCVHNTRQILDLPSDFKVAYRYIKRKWRRYMPIYTTCTVVERFDWDLLNQWKHALIERIRGRPRIPAPRMADPTVIFRGGENAQSVVAVADHDPQAQQRNHVAATESR